MRRAAERKSATESLVAALTAPTGKSGWATAAREAAHERLNAMGLPQRGDEYWRFTDPAQLTHAGGAGVVPALTEVEADHTIRLGTGDWQLNGAVTALPLARALQQDVSFATRQFGTLEAGIHKPVHRPHGALTTAFATEGAAVHVAGDGGRLLLDHEALAAGRLVHSLVVLEPGAKLTLIERGTPRAGGTATLEIRLGDGAELDHLRLQDGLSAGMNLVAAALGEGATYRSFALGLGGDTLRNETHITLAGPDAKAHVAGVWIGQGESQHDDTVFITHAAPNCESRQVFRSVLGAGAIAAFQGKILVEQIAQKTDGYQLSQALLLDEGAQFLGKPELEIYADDVKCSHGSTTGSIDPVALFYLRSRGVPLVQARHLLVLAFLNETLDEVADPALREALENRIVGLADRALA